MFESSGLIRYQENGNAYIEVDAELARYYRSQIPFPTRPQRFAPHITLIRNEIYSGAQETSFIDFQYHHHIYWNEVYVWLAVEAPQAEAFRVGRGLPPISELTQSPSKEHRFHITLGNMKIL